MKTRNLRWARRAILPAFLILALASAQTHGNDILDVSKNNSIQQTPKPPPPDALPFEIVAIIAIAILLILVALIVVKVLNPMRKKINFFIPNYLFTTLAQQGRIFEMIPLLSSIKKGSTTIYTNAENCDPKYYKGVSPLKVEKRDEKEAAELMRLYNIQKDHALALVMANRTESILLRETQDAWLEKVAKERGLKTKVV